MQRPRVISFPNPRRVWSLLANREESVWKKWVVALAVLYVVFPVDAVPDLIPLWGWLDDLGVITLSMAFLSWAVAPYREPVAARVVATRRPR